MIIFPAIDLKDGKCVRLYKGDMNAATIYNEDPTEQAQQFEQAGAKWLHIVDLNGAVEGRSVNTEIVREIKRQSGIRIQLGGGIRDFASIDRWLSTGIDRVILGTVAVRNPDLVREACKLFPGKIALGIDARQGRVAVSGWTENSEVTAIDLVRKFEGLSIAAVIYTDIDRDGTGLGLNIEETVQLAEATSIPVIASGGAGSYDDIEATKQARLHGVILGRAIYDGRIDIAQALQYR